MASKENVTYEEALDLGVTPDFPADVGLYDQGTIGLGVDIVEIARMERILKRSPAFAKRVYSEEERKYCLSTNSPAAHFALRFAAKEAVAKALGTGLTQGVGVHNIEVKRAATGRPYVVLTGNAKKRAEELGVREMPISLSYTRNDAVAFVMAITDDSIRVTEERKDPMEELAKKFKETRDFLDSI